MSRHVEAEKNLNVPHRGQWPHLCNVTKNNPIPEQWGRWAGGTPLGVPLHGFVDDWRLESIWRDRHYQVDRALISGWVTTPDFTIETYHPYYFTAFQVYRSRVIGSFWASMGVHVVPVLQWGNPDYLELTIEGLTGCQILAVRSPSRNSERDWFKVAERINAALPGRTVLHFGTKNGLSVWDKAIPLQLNPSQKGKI
jgi:hypothetical protein